MQEGLEALPFCYVTTAGRRSGRPHRIEIWFALEAGIVYVLMGDGERSDTVRNIVADPRVRLELGPEHGEAIARVVRAHSPEDGLARRLLVEKYQPGYGEDLSTWAREALPVAIEFLAAPDPSGGDDGHGDRHQPSDERGDPQRTQGGPRRRRDAEHRPQDHRDHEDGGDGA
jgi:deazaflavin-dependent oxidoreductase (nitroreductase family)